MTRSPKSKEKHYRLTHAEWLHIIHELKESEKDLLYYLRTLDPFGDRPLNLGVREIARTLQCNPSTISRALKRLDELGYIDMEMVTVRVKVLSKHHTDTESEEVLRPSNSVASEQQVGSQRNKLDRDATSWIAAQHLPARPLAASGF